MSKHEPPVMPPPSRGDNYGNVNRRMVPHIDGRKTKPVKEAAQFNTYVSPGLPDRVAALQLEFQARMKRPKMSRGQFLEHVFDAFENAFNSGAMQFTVATPEPSAPAAADIAASRSMVIECWAKPVLVEEMQGRATSRGWTLGDVLEDMASKAAEWEQAQATIARLEQELASLKKSKGK